MAEVKVRELRGVEELERVVALQQAVWGFADRDVVPAALLIAAQEEGALIAGAFAQGELIGFVFGFPTRDPAQQHSHMLGVLEPYSGTGAALATVLRFVIWAVAAAELGRRANHELVTVVPA